jgi:hypothetical protein
MYEAGLPVHSRFVKDLGTIADLQHDQAIQIYETRISSHLLYHPYHLHHLLPSLGDIPTGQQQ